MPMLTTAATTVALMLTACVASPPSSPPAARSSGSTAASAHPPKTADAWLDRIDRATARIKTLTATVRYDRVQNLLGDHQRRFGELVYAAGAAGAAGNHKDRPARFSIHFDRLVLGDERRRIDQWYIYDGHWLLERDGDDHTATRRELNPPRPTGSPPAANPRFMSLGQGPFALPLDQNKQQLLARFNARLAAPAEDDPENTIHLILTPKPELKLDQQRLDLWYDRDTLLPIRAHTLEKDQSESTFALLQPHINPKLPDTSFDTHLPPGPPWQTQTIPRPTPDSPHTN